MTEELTGYTEKEIRNILVDAKKTDEAASLGYLNLISAFSKIKILRLKEIISGAEMTEFEFKDLTIALNKTNNNYESREY
jgi:hypothetical protein